MPEAFLRAAGALSGRNRLMAARAIIAMVRWYQKHISPAIGQHCKYQPTCSQYMIDAVTKYGALKGTAMGIWRILRCNPFSKGGYDPVR